MSGVVDLNFVHFITGNFYQAYEEINILCLQRSVIEG